MTRYPNYPKETDYTTGAPSYYDDLAKKTALMKHLAMRIWEYDKELSKRFDQWDQNLEEFDDEVLKLLQKWMDDGTFEHIINHQIFGQFVADIDKLNRDLTILKNNTETSLEEMETEINIFRLAVERQLTELKSRRVHVSDYGAMGDGVTDDSNAIQSAFDNASGKTVVFPGKKTFLLKKIIRVNSNTRVILDTGTVLKRGADITAFFINNSDGTNGGYGANRNIHFEGGTLDLNKLNFPSKCTSFAFGHCENISIKNMIFLNMWQWHYIEFSGCKNTLVENCIFDGHEQETASEHVQFDVFKSDTTFPWFGPYDGTPCLFGTVRDSLFKNGRRGIGTHSQVDGKPQRHILIENNRFENMRDYCIGLYDYHDSIVRGNTVVNSHTGLFVLTSAVGATKNIIIENNIMDNLNFSEDSRGIHVDDHAQQVIIKNNIINNVARHGIGLDRCDFGEVTGNIVNGCGRVGIWLYGSFNLSISGNAAHGNNKLKLGFYDMQCGEEDETTVSSTDYIITNNNVGTLGLVRTLNCGVFHNHIDSFFIGDIKTDLLMKDNCVGGSWV